MDTKLMDIKMRHFLHCPRLSGDTFVVALAIVLLTLTCGSSKQGAAERTQPETTIEVQNQNWLDMHVYVLRASHRRSLGMVTAFSSRVFTIPSDLVFGSTTLQFMADPVGSQRTPVSQTIQVLSGDQITMVIPNFSSNR